MKMKNFLKLKRSLNSQAGFSLIEIIIVVAIIYFHFFPHGMKALMHFYISSDVSSRALQR